MPVGIAVKCSETLNAQVNAALADPGLRANMQGLGLEIIGGSPEAFHHHLDTEGKRFRQAVQFTDIKPE
jgi:tripartite-type tricarboxylate transporter receptor subunit TctC